MAPYFTISANPPINSCFSRQGRAGFTLLEMLFVVAILAVIISFSLPLSLDFYQNQQVDAVSGDIVSALRRAQAKAMAMENNFVFGVYFSADNYTLFQGNSYALRNSEQDQVFALSSVLSLSGLSEVVFSKLSGKPLAVGALTLTTSNGQTRDITINEAGLVNLE